MGGIKKMGMWYVERKKMVTGIWAWKGALTLSDFMAILDVGGM